jgi:PAS domain S-box-containing protein
MNIRQLVAPEFVDLVFSRIRVWMRGEQPEFPFEVNLLTRDGHRVPMEITTQLMYAGGKPAGLYGIARDVRSRKLAEAALLHTSDELSIQKAYFEQLFESSPEAIVVQNNAGTILMANREFGRLFAYDPAVIVGKKLDTLIATGEKLEEAAALTRHVAVGGRFNIESERVRSDGSRVCVSILGAPIQVQGGQVAVYVIYRDITERRRAERALVESESKFRAVADTAASAICIHDGKRFLYVNPAAEQITGYTRDELLALDPLSLPHPSDRRVLAQRAEARERGEDVPSRYEFRIVTRSGEERWIDVSAAKIHFGGQLAVLATVVDITDRKHSEQLQSALYQIAHQTSHAEDLPAFYREIHHIVSQLVYARNFYIALYDEDSGTLSWPYFVDEAEPEAPQPRGLRRGLTEYVLRTGKPLLATPELFDKLVAAGEVEPLGADCIDWLGVPLKTCDTTFGVLVLQSYTTQFRFGAAEQDILTFVSQNVATAIQHKRDEERLRRSEAQYRALFSRAAYGIYSVAMDGTILDANPAFIAMIGCGSLEEVRKLNIESDIYVSAEERLRVLDSYNNGGLADNLDARWKCRDGKIIHVKLSGRGVYNANDELEGYEVIAEDVTERRGLEEQLRHAQKMEAVGRLAGGVAHDFNNLLTVIKGYSELMLPHLVDGDPMRAQVDEIRKAADRAASLTRQLLAFSRRQVLAPKVLDPNAVILNMERLLRRLLGEDVALHLQFDPKAGRIKADPGQMEQVIMNLAVNARDAMPTGGHLTIETSNVVLSEPWQQGMKFEPGPHVLIAVSDSGHGMPKDVQNRIFEPFFTTKERGTGLGLSTVYGIVKQSGGYIWVYSEIGRGTTFKIYLPRVDEVPETSHTRSTTTVKRGDETVLLVEDEDGVRALIRQMLQRYGYKVMEAANAGEAFMFSERNTEPIHLLVTDVVLKHISGRELADRITASRPQTRVLYMSGYTEDAVVRHGVLEPGIAFLQKPFTADNLALKVREVLDNGNGA